MFRVSLWDTGDRAELAFSASDRKDMTCSSLLLIRWSTRYACDKNSFAVIVRHPFHCTGTRSKKFAVVFLRGAKYSITLCNIRFHGCRIHMQSSGVHLLTDPSARTGRPRI